MKFDRAQALAFLDDIWGAKDRLSWHVDLSLGSTNAPSTWYLADYKDPGALVATWAPVVHHFEGSHGSLTSYDADVLVGGKVRSSWCFFDHKPEKLLVEVKCPGLILPTLTNKRESWVKAWERSKVHRGQAKFLLDHAIAKSKARARITRVMLCGVSPAGTTFADGEKSNAYDGLLVRITRVAKVLVDHDDNVNTSAKHVRDGVADALGYDDGDFRIAWHYDQRTTTDKELPGVVIRIYERARCFHCNQFTAKRD